MTKREREGRVRQRERESSEWKLEKCTRRTQKKKKEEDNWSKNRIINKRTKIKQKDHNAVRQKIKLSIFKNGEIKT